MEAAFWYYVNFTREGMSGAAVSGLIEMAAASLAVYEVRV